jgi:alanyl-tRNA synthetase
MTAAEKSSVEEIVNQWIWANHRTDTKLQSHDQAIAEGAIGLFGEKYESDVRVVRFGGDSAELCGGTHVESTGEIGSLVITSEGSVARGVRRIEALTSLRAYEFTRKRLNLVSQIAADLKTKPENIRSALANLKKKASGAKPASSADLQQSFVHQKDFTLGSHKIILGQANLEAKELKALADGMLAGGQEGSPAAVCILAVDAEDKRSFRFLSCVKKGVKEVSAKAMIASLLEKLGGRGGGKDSFAQGGAKSDEPLEAVLKVWEQAISGYTKNA